MEKYMWKTVGIAACCGVLTFASPFNAKADEVSGPGMNSGGYVVTVDAESVNINKDYESEEVLVKAVKGATYQVVEDMGDGWVKVKVDNTYGYLPAGGNATISLAEENSDGEIPAEENTSSASRRQGIVNYALQFVGGRYVYGGNDPHTGVDCSGFTRYVMQNAAGVSLNRSSGSQASQGRAVSADQMRPGDLIFYGNGRSINHVAMYIGNGQIVHASTYKTGIKTSPWNYRSPVKIINVLGD